MLGAFENSKITPNSANFRGGNINIRTQGLFKSLDSAITASGATSALSGNVLISTLTHQHVAPFYSHPPHQHVAPFHKIVTTVINFIRDRRLLQTASKTLSRYQEAVLLKFSRSKAQLR